MSSSLTLNLPVLSRQCYQDVRKKIVAMTFDTSLVTSQSAEQAKYSTQKCMPAIGSPGNIGELAHNVGIALFCAAQLSAVHVSVAQRGWCGLAFEEPKKFSSCLFVRVCAQCVAAYHTDKSHCAASCAFAHIRTVQCSVAGVITCIRNQK